MDIPAKLGPYQIMEKIGSGGLGRVYKAIDQRTGQTVAIKFLHEKFANNRKLLGIFHRELLIGSRLQHKHIVEFVDAHFDPPFCFIVSRFIDGWSGHSFLKIVKKVPPLVALSIVIDMMQGIDYLHLHETVHSDLSAANFLIEKTGRVLVTDFGLAAEENIEDYKNFMVGTPGYYSPEHITNNPLTPATDIYCAGLILFELITGRKAVPPSANTKKVLHYMKRIPFGLIRCSDKKMEKALRTMLKSALHPNPRKRMNSSEQMMLACYQILKFYNIRFARYAIKQYLQDRGLVRQTTVAAPQDIYRGAA